MSTLTLTPTALRNGVWEAVIKQAGKGVPRIQVQHRDKTVPEIELKEAERDHWLLRVPVPAEAIADGVQVIVVNDESDGEVIGQCTLFAGDTVGGDVRAELELLRAELDMLKRAFRRHCLET